MTPKAGVKWQQDSDCLGANAGARNGEKDEKKTCTVFYENNFPHHIYFYGTSLH